MADLTPEVRAANLLANITEDSVQLIGRPRASSLYDCCVRMHVFGTLHSLKKRERLVASQLVTFGIGTAFHTWVQNVSSFFGGRVVGVWRCLACGWKSNLVNKRPKKCKGCGARGAALEYHELTLDHPELTGHPDLLLSSTKKDKLIISELKTISVDGFAGLVAPLISHTWQLSAYTNYAAHIKEIDGQRMARFGYIIYFSKAHTNGFPAKAFKVSLEEPILEAISDKLAAYRRGVDSKGEDLPEPLRECVAQGWRHRSCPAKALCFP
jgi:hypothetical protein